MFTSLLRCVEVLKPGVLTRVLMWRVLFKICDNTVSMHFDDYINICANDGNLVVIMLSIVEP
jgi:hypothetical protein